MAKKLKKYSITRRTLNRLFKLIPPKRRKNIEIGLKDRTGTHRIGGGKKARRAKAKRRRR